jgi:hypothetical protein
MGDADDDEITTRPFSTLAVTNFSTKRDDKVQTDAYIWLAPCFQRLYRLAKAFIPGASVFGYALAGPVHKQTTRKRSMKRPFSQTRVFHNMKPMLQYKDENEIRNLTSTTLP